MKVDPSSLTCSGWPFACSNPDSSYLRGSINDNSVFISSSIGSINATGKESNKVQWSAVALELFDGMMCEINIFLAAFMVVQVPGVSLSSSAYGSKAFRRCLVFSLTDHWNSPYRWKRAARPGKPQSHPTAAHREMERMILVLNYWCFLYFLDVVIDVTIALCPRLKNLLGNGFIDLLSVSTTIERCQMLWYE